MGLFERKKEGKKEGKKGLADARVYAFIGLGTMARFMNEEQLGELVKTLPALIARECGTGADNVVVVQGQDWAPEGKEFANSCNADGTPAFPAAAQKICEDYLRSKGLHEHVVGDIQLLGVLSRDHRLSFGTRDDLKAKGTEILAVSILVSAWLAFHRSTLKA
jgi:hypothetical protein